jgi:hypothetical protein
VCAAAAAAAAAAAPGCAAISIIRAGASCACIARHVIAASPARHLFISLLFIPPFSHFVCSFVIGKKTPLLEVELG